MTRLRFDAGQRFTCAGCARCCHSEVAITPAEHAAYERAGASRWYRESEGAAEGAGRDPFLPFPERPGWFVIRRRADGTCGFLSSENRCRLHEELGGARKPLVCRLFPFQIHATDKERIVAASFTCPTIAANDGAPVALPALRALEGEWAAAFGRAERPLQLSAGRPMNTRALDAMRTALLHMLDVQGPDGRIQHRRNIRRIGLWLEDLSRARVVGLPPADFDEYVSVTGRYTAASERPLEDRGPGRLSRLFFRGFLFTIASAEAQRRYRAAGLQLGLRWRLFRILLHAHGLGPATPELDLGPRRRLRVDADATGALVRHYLRASFETLGTGTRPVLDELAFIAAVLHGGIVLGAMEAARAGEGTLGARALREGLVRAADVAHVEGPAARLLDTFAGGPDAFLLLAESL